MAALAFTAATRRTHHDFRLAVTARDRTELKSRLTAWVEDQSGPAVSGRRLSAGRRIAFVFPGQGGQWAGMGRSLLREVPVFRDVLEKCDLAIRKHTGWSVVELLLSAESENSFSEVDIVQPALFAVMVGLASLWRSWGLEPDAVVGHSMGECAAAAISGALTLEDAAAVICHRSLLMKGASGRGLMAVTNLSPGVRQLAWRRNMTDVSRWPPTTAPRRPPFPATRLPWNKPWRRLRAARSSAGALRWTWHRTARTWSRSGKNWHAA